MKSSELKNGMLISFIEHSNSYKQFAFVRSLLHGCVELENLKQTEGAILDKKSYRKINFDNFHEVKFIMYELDELDEFYIKDSGDYVYVVRASKTHVEIADTDEYGMYRETFKRETFYNKFISGEFSLHSKRARKPKPSARKKEVPDTPAAVYKVDEIIKKMKAGDFFFRDSNEVFCCQGFNDFTREFVVQLKNSSIKPITMSYDSVYQKLLKAHYIEYKEIISGDIIEFVDDGVDMVAVSTARNSISFVHKPSGQIRTISKLEIYNDLLKGKIFLKKEKMVDFSFDYPTIEKHLELSRGLRDSFSVTGTSEQKSVISVNSRPEFIIVDDLDKNISESDVKKLVEKVSVEKKKSTNRPFTESVFKIPLISYKKSWPKPYKEKITEFISVRKS